MQTIKRMIMNRWSESWFLGNTGSDSLYDNFYWLFWTQIICLKCHV